MLRDGIEMTINGFTMMIEGVNILIEGTEPQEPILNKPTEKEFNNLP
jgi:hypothetical protein